jgi:hypothetical protein
MIVEYWKSDGVTDPTADPDSIPWTQYGRETYASEHGEDRHHGPDRRRDLLRRAELRRQRETGDRLVLGPATIAVTTQTRS